MRLSVEKTCHPLLGGLRKRGARAVRANGLESKVCGRGHLCVITPFSLAGLKTIRQEGNGQTRAGAAARKLSRRRGARTKTAPFHRI
ncbi:hypothetical protein EVAR_2211_1 [Eumeta japonica]|uniref:Uncharacterized protein n=1 Tax=Eumeta variegata TaxID=151549 RepID=A0A4C1SFT9_EUMVA|nr:hypothetical protein EVAR_2211_1 [Eumeta japonica]